MAIMEWEEREGKEKGGTGPQVGGWQSGSGGRLFSLGVGGS